MRPGLISSLAVLAGQSQGALTLFSRSIDSPVQQTHLAQPGEPQRPARFTTNDLGLLLGFFHQWDRVAKPSCKSVSIAQIGADLCRQYPNLARIADFLASFERADRECEIALDQKQKSQATVSIGEAVRRSRSLRRFECQSRR